MRSDPWLEGCGLWANQEQPTRTSAFPEAFRISTFSFPHYEEGEYSGSRGAAEHAERIQFSSLRALRASA